MEKIVNYIYVGYNTKKGILQSIYKYNELFDKSFNPFNGVEYIYYYHEVFNDEEGYMKIDLSKSCFSEIYYFGKRIDNNHCLSYSGSVYELNENDVVINCYNDYLKLKLKA